MANEDINYKINADTSKAQKGAEEVGKKFAKASEQVEDTNKALKNTASSGGKFGKVMGGIKFGAGLAVGKGVLDKVFGSLVENEKVANLFSDALSVVSGVAEGLAEILEPAFKAIGDAIKNPKQAWDDIVSAFERGAKWIKENLIDGVLAIFTEQINNLEIGILKLRKGWNEWTGDTEEASEMQERINALQKENIEIAKEQAKRTENVKGAINAVVDTAKQWGNTIAKNVEKTVKGNKALRDAQVSYIALNAQIEENIKSLERQQAQNEAIANNETKTFEERRKAINENLELKKQQIELEKQLLQNQINELALENKAKGNRAERNAQIQALNIQMKGLDGTIQETQLSVDETLRGIAEQEKESTKAIGDAILERNRMEAEATANIGLLEHEKLKATLDTIDAQKKAFLSAYDERLAKETEGTAKYNEILAERTMKEGEFNAQRITAEGEYDTAVKEYDKSQREMAIASMQAKANALQQGLNLAKTLVGDNAEMQSAIAIAEAIMQTYVGANVALASSPPPLNFINMAGVIAGGLANVIKIRQEAMKVASVTGGSAPSGGGGMSAPPIGPNISIARGNVVDSNMQLKQAMNQAQKPPRAYVVQSDINSSESLNRKILENATI
jgi:hypothetical protein